MKNLINLEMGMNEGLNEKYKNKLFSLGGNVGIEDENQLVEDLILKYYTTSDVSDEEIVEMKFVFERIYKMSLINRILTSYFSEKYITVRFDEYGYKWDKLTFVKD